MMTDRSMMCSAPRSSTSHLAGAQFVRCKHHTQLATHAISFVLFLPSEHAGSIVEFRPCRRCLPRPANSLAPLVTDSMHAMERVHARETVGRTIVASALQHCGFGGAQHA